MSGGYAVNGSGRAHPENGHEAAAEEPIVPVTRVVVQPIGRRATVPGGTILLAAIRAAGLELVSVCGGRGLCGSCRVTAWGGLSPPTGQERELLAAAELSAGVRLACQAAVVGDVRVDVPPGALTAPQRLQFEGQAVTAAALDPAVVALDVQISPPALGDLRSDASRLEDAVAAAGQPATRTSLAVLSEASTTLRARHWAVRAVVHRGRPGESATEIVALLPGGTVPLGAAIDAGTTKLAAYLVNLETGETVAKGAATNPQVAVGEDVMSRIAYADASGTGARELHSRLLDGVNRLLGELRDQVGASATDLVDAVAVGNTAMHHLLVGLPLRQLGRAPYVPAVTEALELRGADIGLALAPGALLYLPPNIAGFVGADHTAALLAAGVSESARTTLVLDIGTNTEISIGYDGRLWACSCASGPAFEGAHIRDGMHAAAGAIERVSYLDGRFQVQTIGGGAPTGICGSGILDAVVAALAAGVVDERGRLSRTHPLVTRSGGEPACVLVPAAQTGHGRDIVLTRSDIGEIQLAKAAIRAGIELLLAAAGVDAGALQEVVVAGAFGTYLDVTSAVTAGMLPRLPAERYRQIGNAAGLGARQLLVSRQRRAMADEIARRVQYVELTTHPDFADAFTRELTFGRAVREPANGSAT